jgi:hypothetical protein
LGKFWERFSSVRLQRLQNRAARMITQSNYEIRSKGILAKLNWDNLKQKRDKACSNQETTFIQKIFQNLFHQSAIKLTTI